MGMESPETNGVSIGPNKPVTPPMPIASKMALAATARKGPMKGTASRIGVKAAEIATRRAAETNPNWRLGIPCTTAATFHEPPDRVTERPKSAVTWRKSEIETGTEIVGQSTQISGVHTFPTQGILMHTWGMQKSGRNVERSMPNEKLSDQLSWKSSIRMVPGAIRSTLPGAKEAAAE